MKKILIIFLLFPALKLYSQVGYSINCGPNISIFTFSGEDQKTSISVGGYLENEFQFSIYKTISFSTGFGFSLKRSKFQRDYYYPYATYIEPTHCYSLYTANVPFMLNICDKENKIKASCGVELETLIQAKDKLKSNSVAVYYTKSDFEAYYFNIKFGLEFKIMKSVFLGLKYQRNISPLFMKPDNYFYQPLKSDKSERKLTTFSLNISYNFK